MNVRQYVGMERMKARHLAAYSAHPLSRGERGVCSLLLPSHGQTRTHRRTDAPTHNSYHC